LRCCLAITTINSRTRPKRSLEAIDTPGIFKHESGSLGRISVGGAQSYKPYRTAGKPDTLSADIPPPATSTVSSAVPPLASVAAPRFGTRVRPSDFQVSK